MTKDEFMRQRNSLGQGQGSSEKRSSSVAASGTANNRMTKELFTSMRQNGQRPWTSTPEEAKARWAGESRVVTLGQEEKKQQVADQLRQTLDTFAAREELAELLKQREDYDKAVEEALGSGLDSDSWYSTALLKSRLAAMNTHSSMTKGTLETAINKLMQKKAEEGSLDGALSEKVSDAEESASAYEEAMKQLAYARAYRFSTMPEREDFEERSAEGLRGLEEQRADALAATLKAAMGTQYAKDDSFWEVFKSMLIANPAPSATGTGSPNFNTSVEMYRSEAPMDELPTDEWSEEQKKIYGYLRSMDTENGGSEAAEYGRQINDSLAQSKKEAELQKITGVGNLGLAGEAVTARVTGLLSGVDYFNKVLEYGGKGYTTVDPYVTLTDYTEAVDSETARRLSNWSGTIDDDVFLLGGKGLGDVYQLGTSMIDSVVSANLGGELGSLAIFFGKAASSGYSDALRRGADPGQALAYGFAQGTAEAFFEKFSVESLLDWDKIATRSFVENLLAHGLTEASEEFCTSIANTLNDVLILKEKGELESAIREAMGDGLSYEEAAKKVMLDTFESWTYDAVGGFVSGAGSMALQQAGGRIAYNLSDYEGDARGMIETARALEDKNAAAQADRMEQRLERRSRNGAEGTLTNAEAGKLGRSIGQAMDTADRSDRVEAVKARLQELGSGEMSGKLAETIVKAQEKKTLSRAETDMLRNSDYAKQVLREFSGFGTRQGQAHTVTLGESKGHPAQSGMTVRATMPGRGEDSAAWARNIGQYRYQTETFGKKDLPKSAKAEEQTKAKAEQKTAQRPVQVPERLPFHSTVSEAEREQLRRSVEALNLGEDAKTVAAAFHGGKSVDSYVADMNAAINLFAANGVSLEIMRKSALARGLSEDQIDAAWVAGRRKYDARMQKAAEQSRKGSEREVIDIKPGRVDYDSGATVKGVKYKGVDKSSLSRAQKRQIDASAAVAKAFGLELVLFDGEKTGGTQGVYQSGGRILLNVNAGAAIGETLIVSTFSHELTHFAEEYGGEAYEELRRYAIKYLAENDRERFEQIVTEKMKSLNLDYDEALSEVIADGCELMLRDTNAPALLARENPSLLQRICDWIGDLTEKLRAAFEGVGLRHEEARILMKESLELQKRWDAALAEAVQNREAIRADQTEESKNAAPEGGKEQYSKEGVNEYGEEVYKTEEQLKNLTYAEKLELFKANFYMPGSPQYIGSRVRFETKTGSYFAEIDRQTQRENIKKINPGRLNQSDKAKINIGAAGDFVTLLENARIDKENVPLKKNNNDAKKGVTNLDYFLKNVEVDGKRFKVIINIRKTVNGKYVYEVKLSPIKKNSSFSSQPGETQRQPARQEPLHRSSKKMVSQAASDVKVQFSVWNESYTAAIEEGDIEEAQKIVDEAAKAAGYTIKAFHGTNSREEKNKWNDKTKTWDTEYRKFTVFKKTYAEQPGHFFASDEENAGGYGSTVYSVYLMIKKPLIIDCKGQNYDSIRFDGQEMDSYEWAEYAKKNRYDGVIFRNIRDGVGFGDLSKSLDEYVVFDSNRIKSADPITYDDDGSIIPISERFTPTRRDIRYSEWDGGVSDRELLREAAEREDASEAVKAYARKVNNLEAYQRRLERQQKKLNAEDLSTEERDALAGRIADTQALIEKTNKALINLELRSDMRREADAARERWWSTNVGDAVETSRNLQRENRELKQMVEYFREQAKLTTPEEKTVDPADVRRFAKALIKEHGSSVDVGTLSEHLQELGDMLVSNDEGRGLSDRELRKSARAAARAIIDEVYEENRDAEDLRREIAGVVRSARLQISDELRGDKADFNLWRKANLGRFTLVNEGGTPIDSFYKELAATYGEGMFPTDITAQADMLDRISNLMDGLKGQRTYAYSRYEREEIIGLVAEEIMDTMLSGEIRAAETIADRNYRKMQERMLDARERASKAEREAERAGRRADRAEETALRQAREEQKAITREKIKDLRQELNESREAQQTRINIERTRARLSKLLRENSKAKHLPEILRGDIGKFLLSLDTLGPFSAGTKSEARFREEMQEIERALGRIKDSGDLEKVYGSLELSDGVKAMLQNNIDQVRAAIGDGGEKVTRKMGLKELQALEESLNIISTAVSNMNELLSDGEHRFAAVDELSESAISEWDKLKARTLRSEAGEKAEELLEYGNIVPRYYFKRMGEAGEEIYRGLIRGQDKVAILQEMVTERVQKVYEDNKVTAKEIKAWEKHENEIKLIPAKKLQESTVKSGEMNPRAGEETVYLTDAQAMEIYILSKREAGRNHLYGVGIKPEKHKAQGTKNRIQDEWYTLMPEDMAKIHNMLTDQQKATADALGTLLDSLGKELGNEISMKLFGIRLYEEEHYWPIRTDSDSNEARTEAAKTGSLYRIGNQGWTKSLTREAKNAVRIGSIFDTFAEHAAQVIQYNAMTLPVLDAVKFLNYQGEGTSVRQSMRRAHGDAAVKYLVDLLQDVNGGVDAPRAEKLYSKLMANVKVSQVGANVRVALQQPTSVMRATLMINPKYIALGAAKKGGLKEALQYSGLAKWKHNGHYDTNISRSLAEELKGTKTLKQKIQDVSLKGAELGDAATLGTLWNACKIETQEKTGLNGDALIQKTVERYEDLLLSTQVIDGMLMRSPNMRNKSALLKEFTAYKAELSLNYSIVMDLKSQFDKELRTNGMKAAINKMFQPTMRTAAVWAATNVLLAVAQAVGDAGRDDDDYETWWQKFTQHWVEDFLDDINPLSWVPILDDLITVLTGRDKDLLGLLPFKQARAFFAAIVEKLELATGKIDKPTAATKYGRTTNVGLAYMGLQAVSGLFGIPGSGAAREAIAGYNTLRTLWNDMYGTKNDMKLPALRTYEPGAKNEIKNAWEHKYLTDEEAIALLIEEGEAKNETAAKKIIYGWELGGTAAYKAVKDAAVSGDTKAYQEAMKAMTDAGYTVKEVQTQVRGAIKQQYQAPESGLKLSKAYCIDYLMRYTGMDRAEATEQAQEWTCYVVTGIQYDDLKAAFDAGEIDKWRAIDLLVTYGGKTREAAQRQVENWMK